MAATESKAAPSVDGGGLSRLKANGDCALGRSVYRQDTSRGNAAASNEFWQGDAWQGTASQGQAWRGKAGMPLVWVLVLAASSLGPSAQLPGAFPNRAACESVGSIVLDGLHWACIEVIKPVVLS